MALDFPSSPTTGQIYTSGDRSWVWNGTQWDSNGLTPTSSFSRNRIINGDFQVWQRGGGAFTTNGAYTADQWQILHSGSSQSVTRQTFTAGNPISGYEPAYYWRTVVTSSANAANYAQNNYYMESVRTFAGQTVTVSFWAKADATKNVALELKQDFGTGGSPSSGVLGIGSRLVALTATWQRYSYTVAIPSISGKTLGTTHDGSLQLSFWFDAGSSYASRSASLGQQSGTFDIWGVQVEAGTVATTFETRTYGAQLDSCLRYLHAYGGEVVYEKVGFGFYTSTTVCQVHAFLSVPMRAIPAITTSGNWQFSDGVAGLAGSSLSVVSAESSTKVVTIQGTVTGATQYRPARLESANSTASRIYLSAEL